MNPLSDNDTTRERLARIEAKLDHFLFRIEATDKRILELEAYHGAFALTPAQFSEWKLRVDEMVKTYENEVLVARTQSKMRKGIFAVVYSAFGAGIAFISPHLPGWLGK